MAQQSQPESLGLGWVRKERKGSRTDFDISSLISASCLILYHPAIQDREKIQRKKRVGFAVSLFNALIGVGEFNFNGDEFN